MTGRRSVDLLLASRYRLRSMRSIAGPVWALATFATAMLAAVPVRAEPVRLAAQGQWVVQYNAEKCRALREFGTGENSLLLMIEKTAPGDQFLLVLAGQSLEWPRQYLGRATVQFGEFEAAQASDFFVGDIADKPALVFREKLRIAAMSEDERAQAQEMDAKGVPVRQRDRISPERNAAVKFIWVDMGEARVLELETGGMRGLFTAMDACVDNMIASWGYDLDRRASMTRDVVPLNTSDWWRGAEYPARMQAVQAEAVIDFRLAVDKTGAVTDCIIQGGTDPEGFDRTLCATLSRRARFEPALDEDGVAMPSFYQSTAIFSMER